MRLSKNDFAELVREALADVPSQFAEYLESIAIDVESIPDEETCQSLGIDDPFELMGLYHGTPLTERGEEGPAELPDRIVIYQRCIEACCKDREEVVEEIRTTVLHEIGHHFGLDEDDLDSLGYA